MKIVGLTPGNPFTGETPEQLYLKKLRELGHEVLIGERFIEIPLDTDVVVAMSEVSCENAYQLAKAYKKPFYAHMEWLPPWRIFKDPESSWGLETTQLSFRQKMNFVKTYLNYSYFWAQADIKTLAADCFHQDMKDFLGKELVIYTKYLGPNTDRIKEYLKANSEPPIKQNEITCIARFVHHKRLHHVIQALHLIGFTGTLNLVGYGPETEYYEMIKGNLNVKYYDSKDKFDCLSRSKLSIALWSGICPAESMYLGTPCITYDHPYMTELYGNSIVYARNNDIDDLAKKIQMVLKLTNDGRESICKIGVAKIENDEINTHTLEKSVKLLEQLIMRAVRK